MITFGALKYLSLHNMTLHEDLTRDHFMKIPPDKGRFIHQEHHRKLSTVPESLDWRDHDVVGPVHNQQECNSCWAFAAAGTMEYWLKKEQPDAEIDVQNVLDCAPRTFGCIGGLMEHAFEYDGYFPLKYNYNDKAGKCTPSDTGVHVDSFLAVDHQIEHSLAYMIHKWGPVSIAVDLTKHKNNKGDLIKAADCTGKARHAVLAVGYTPEYWNVKNSMGTEWGDEGYGYIERGKKACGIDTYASVVTGITIK